MTEWAVLRELNRYRHRLRVLVVTVVALGRLEIPVRTRPLPALCDAAGITFAAFSPVPPNLDETPLPRHVADAWWAVDTVLSWWPLARRRPCLRRALLLGRQINYLSPSLALEITTVNPFAAHAFLVARGHRLDMGVLDSSADHGPSGPLQP